MLERFAMPEGVNPRPAAVTGASLWSDVAKIARVSPITVSRVLSNPRLVAAETAAQVQRVIAHRVCPESSGGRLPPRARRRLVTAIVPTMANQRFAQTVEAFREELLTAGYQLMVGSQRGWRLAGRQPAQCGHQPPPRRHPCSPAWFTRRCCRADSSRARAFRSSRPGSHRRPSRCRRRSPTRRWGARWPSISSPRDVAASG